MKACYSCEKILELSQSFCPTCGAAATEPTCENCGIIEELYLRVANGGKEETLGEFCGKCGTKFRD